MAIVERLAKHVADFGVLYTTIITGMSVDLTFWLFIK